LKKYNQPFSTLTREEIRGLFDVNVLGVINCSLACRESMRQRGGGVIVNVASAAAFSVTTPYGATKLAVRGLTMIFAKEFAGDNIRVNAIAPGLIGTENAKAEFTDEEFESAVTNRQLIKRRGTMDDVARVVVFLCSDDSAFITGETTRVTGGGYLSV
jgi:3-oxoacyl-[acyl-carrier protein] reductase